MHIQLTSIAGPAASIAQHALKACHTEVEPYLVTQQPAEVKQSHECQHEVGHRAGLAGTVISNDRTSPASSCQNAFILSAF